MFLRRSRTRPTRVLKNQRLFIALGVMLLVAASAYGLHRVQLDRHSVTILERARASVEDRKPLPALELYKQYLQYRPQDLDALSEFAGLLKELAKDDPRRTRDTVVAYESLLTIGPGRNAERRILAEIYLSVNNPALARKHLGYLVNPRQGNFLNDPELFVWLARLDWADRKWEDAKANFRQAISAGKAPASTSLELATMIRESRRNQYAAEADKVMADLVAARPQDPDAWLTRSQYRLQNGDRRGAKDDVLYAYQRLPHARMIPDVILAFAQIMVQDGELKTARQALETGLKQHPDHQALTLGLVEVLVRSNDFATARQLLQQSIQHLPDGDLRLAEFADRFLDFGDRESVEKLLPRLGTSAPAKAYTDFLRGRVSALQGDWPAALPKLRGALPFIQTRSKNQTIKLHMALARCYGLANSLDQQDDSYAAALALEPDLLPARFGRADTLARLGRLDEAAEIYEQLAVTSPVARWQIVRIRFAQALANPQQDRGWIAFDTAIGSGAVPVEVEVLRAVAQYFRGKGDTAEKNLQEIVKRPQAPAQAWATLALLQGTQGRPESLKTLDQADRTLGVSADLRLARAQLLAQAPQAKPEPIAALAAGAEKLPQDEQFRLALGLGQLLVALQHPPAALPLLQRAAQLSPFDLTSRTMLLELARPLNDLKLRQQMLEEIRAIDGEAGPTLIAALVGLELAEVKEKPSAGQLAIWKDRLRTALERRGNWSRLHALQGDVALLAERPNEAITHYRRAFELGERSPDLVRRTVKLLMERQAETEALYVLEQAAYADGLSTDLRNLWRVLQSANQQKRDLGVEWARSAEMSRSHHAFDHLARARIFLTNHQFPEAKAAISQALELQPKAPEVYALLVRYLAIVGERAAMQTWAEKARAVHAEPATPKLDDPTRWPLALATIAELVQDLPEAERQYREVIRLRPNDLPPIQRLEAFFATTDQTQANELFLKSLESSGRPELIRWSRRTRALRLAPSPDQMQDWPIAQELIETNLKENPGEPEDLRALAFLQGLDSKQRGTAIQRIRESARRLPLKPEELFRLARLHLWAGDPEQAVGILQEATRPPVGVPPEALALLCRLQLARGDKPLAKQTLGRLKLAVPNSWIAAAEESRWLAANQDWRGASRVVRESTACRTPESKRFLAAPHLESIGCFDEAELLLNEWLTHSQADRPMLAHTPLVEFLTRQRRFAEAQKLIRTHQDDAPLGLTCRLLAEISRLQPIALFPAADQPLARQETAKIEKYVTDQLTTFPQNDDLLYAAACFAEATGRYADAITLYGKAAPLASKSLRAEALRNLAFLIAHTEKDPDDRVLEPIQEAIATRGATASLLDVRSLVHLKTNRLEEALADSEAALGSEPSPILLFHRARILDRLERTTARNATLEQVRKAGLTKAHLHPLEWPDFDRLIKD